MCALKSAGLAFGTSGALGIDPLTGITGENSEFSMPRAREGES